MIINYSELKKKDVVDISTGKNLGKINDLVIDGDKGVILKVIVPGKKNGFLSCEENEIDFKCIVKIGDDTILYKKCCIKESKCQVEELSCDFDDE